MDLKNFFADLSGFNFQSSISKYEENFRGKFLLDLGGVPEIKPYKCFSSDCSGTMTPCRSARHLFGINFVCKKCCKSVSWSKGTWFERMKIDYHECLMLIWCWCNNITLTKLSPFLDISSRSLNDFYCLLREICSLYYLQAETTKIGGKDIIIEVDETHLHTRKYNRGRLLAAESKQFWVFGGCERITKRCFIVLVKDRTSDTLITEIQKHVNPGSIIISDKWRAYCKLNEFGYQHYTVNHSENFISPDASWIHTQNIERLWLSLKETIPRKTNCSQLAS